MGMKISAYRVRVKVHIQTEIFFWHNLISFIKIFKHSLLTKITVLIPPPIPSYSVTQPYFNSWRL